ncbi:MAG: hypothetical protein HDT27_05090 [Subdoligranulum sp.]|nr:hypothetical protein [Subdoligranulum sp.]
MVFLLYHFFWKKSQEKRRRDLQILRAKIVQFDKYFQQCFAVKNIIENMSFSHAQPQAALFLGCIV